MNRKIRMVFSTLLALSIIVTSSVSSLALEDNRIDRLIALGVTAEDVHNLPNYIIDDLLLSGNEIVSYTISSARMEEPAVAATDESASDNGKLTRGFISQDDLFVYNFVTRINEKGASYDNLEFATYANWKNNPFWRLTDVIATAWGGGFTMYSESCTYTISSGSQDTVYNCPRASVTPDAGVAHSVKMLSTGSVHRIAQKIKVYKLNGTGSTTVVTDYAHLMVVGTIGVTIAADPSITFSGGLSHDTASPGFTSFNY